MIDRRVALELACGACQRPGVTLGVDMPCSPKTTCFLFDTDQPTWFTGISETSFIHEDRMVPSRMGSAIRPNTRLMVRRGAGSGKTRRDFDLRITKIRASP